VAIDRAATLKNAEKLLRQGKIEPAIAEYVRLVDDSPRDWNLANTLGDLYVRANQSDKAVDQFTRMADSLTDEGFLPKASAIYKKILKLRPEHDHALAQAADIAATLGLLVDARLYFGEIIARRQGRGDEAGVAQARIRLAALNPADVDAQPAAVAAAVHTDLSPEVLGDAARADPAHHETVDPRALLTAAEGALRGDTPEDGIASVRRLLDQYPDHQEDVAFLGWSIAEQAPELGFRIVDLAADAAVAGQDWASAAAALQEFVTRVPNHIPALMRLVEVCVDGGLEATMYSAQADLADAYIASGQAVEARFIAEDLVAREPWDRANIERFRRALELLGEPDPEAVIADRLSGESPFTTTDLFFDSREAAAQRHEEPPAVEPPAPLPPMPAPHGNDRQIFELGSNAIDLDSILGDIESPPAVAHAFSDSVEVDLSIVLNDIPRPQDSWTPPGAAAVDTTSGDANDIDGVFAHLRDDSERRSQEAVQQYARAMALHDAGDIDNSIPAFEAASQAPRFRFVTASVLARIFRDRGMMAEAIEWFEKAAQAPPPSAEEGHALLYDLAELLEKEGEVARALAILMELQTDAGAYRDVAAGIARLTKVQPRG
jgi:tetratricopeptide (TPR) repeat protein